MADFPIRDPNNVPMVWISDLGASGFLNGSINVTLLTNLWTPQSLGEGTVTVPPDLIVGARLRFDLFFAQQLRDTLDQIIQQNTKPDPMSVQ